MIQVKILVLEIFEKSGDVFLTKKEDMSGYERTSGNPTGSPCANRSDEDSKFRELFYFIHSTKIIRVAMPSVYVCPLHILICHKGVRRKIVGLLRFRAEVSPTLCE